MTVRFRLIFSPLLIAWLLLTSAVAAANPLYQQGKQHWLAGDYAAAMTALLEVRQQAYGRTAEIDYMLGTSGCRLPGRQDWGLRVLNFTLYSYALDTPSRARVKTEMQSCHLATAAQPTLAATAVGTLLVAGASGQGKMYYSVGQDNSLLSYPAKRVLDIPDAEFSSRLFTIDQPAAAAERVRRLVPSFTVHASGRFVMATQSGQSIAELDRIAASLERYFDFLQRQFDISRPPTLISIYLVPSIADLRKLAKQLHGLAVNPATIGYTYRDDQSAVALVSGVKTGTLYHELFHLSVRRQFGDIPQWLDEGIASLYEVSSFRGDSLFGEPNWRGEIIKQLGHELPSLERIITADWFPFDASDFEQDRDQIGVSTQQLALQSAVNRYFILYLQEQGRLADVYRSFRDRQPDDFPADPKRDAVARVEAVLQQPLPETQAAFSGWLKQVLKDGLARPATSDNVGKDLPTPKSKP